uniref:Mesoderm induction early response 1, family member 3 b n=1 Tax=Denticeps clupeoides TaxID=299321 RepID=A0AAY4D141_9TELE
LQAPVGSSSPVGSLSSEDHDFDPTAEMLVHDFDDEKTLEEEEMLECKRNVSAEIEDLEKEGSMPLEELLVMYRYAAASSMDSSSGELADELPDMTLDKEEIAKDLLSGEYEEETQSSADDLTPSVTSHETTEFFPNKPRSTSACDGERDSEGEEDDPEEDTRKEIMVGSQYQADVPTGLCSYGDEEMAAEVEDQLLWSPGHLSQSAVEDFLCEVASRRESGETRTHVRDNEQALYELVKCNYNTREALERYNNNIRSSKEGSPPWSEEECRDFEHALRTYEKNFHLIQKHKVRTRSVAECVAFYYMWKKSERFDHLAQQRRSGKRKYGCRPGVIELMDRLVDGAETLGTDGSSSGCSGAGGSRTDASAGQQLGILNSITASDLTVLSSTMASVYSAADGTCLDSCNFLPLENTHRGATSPDHPPGFSPGGDAGRPGVLEGGFCLSGACGGTDCEWLDKRMKRTLPEPYIGDVSVANLDVDLEGHCTHRITGAKMAVSVTDFGSLAPSEPSGFMGSHPWHHQHTAVQLD